MFNLFGGKSMSWIWVVVACLLFGGMGKKNECECPCQKPCKDMCCI